MKCGKWGVTGDRCGMVSSWLLLAGFLLSLAALSGCSPSEELGEVYGRVTFRGQPVTPALISFANREKGVNMLAEVGADGAYRVVMAKGAGLPLGNYRVAVTPPLADVPFGARTGPLPKAIKNDLIPEKYRRVETSPLSLEVRSGENPFDVELAP